MRRIFFLCLGSNIHPEIHIPAGLALLKKELNVKKISSIYETDPVGPTGPSKFWNLAVAIETDLNRKQLIAHLRKIEDELGRVRAQDRFAPRTMDIDILPQPDYQQLAFTMIPLAEIAPLDKDPQTGKTFRELAENLKKGSQGFKKISAAQSSL